MERDEDFRYLGAWVDGSGRDVGVGGAQSWRALGGLSGVWVSGVSPALGRRFFVAAVGSVLLCGCGCWTLSEKQEKSLNGT